MVKKLGVTGMWKEGSLVCRKMHMYSHYGDQITFVDYYISYIVYISYVVYLLVV